jgi:hypothetical protein
MSLLEELKQLQQSRTLEGAQLPTDSRGPRSQKQQYESNESNEEIDTAREPNPVTCRGCGVVIPSGTTLCVGCGAARSPLVRYAVELSELANERTLRGRALVALDRRRYPQLQLAKGRRVGPGLVSWCPVLRAADAKTLRRIIELAERSQAGSTDD